MARVTKSLAVAIALALMGTGTMAHAEIVRVRDQIEFVGAPQSVQSWNAPAPRKSLQWDAKGRWGLRLDMDQPNNREMNLNDVQAGAFFRITPSLRVGGTVGLRDRFASQPQQMQPQDARPRVHLETAFQF
jgi:hypothetical protein